MVRRDAALAAILAVAVLVGGATVTAQPARELVVERVDTGTTVLAVPVENGSHVGLEYDHSVEGSRVYDGYRVRGDRLVNTRMEFESYGWGLPARANVTRENGTFVYDPPGTYREVYVAPGEIAGHRLHVADRSYDLVDLSGGASVRIHVRHRPPLERLQ